MPALAYPKVAGITAPANKVPDNTDPNIVIRLTLTSYSVRSRRSKVSITQSLPLTDIYDGTTWGGTAVADGPQELPKTTLAGHIDTPLDADNLPTVMAGTQHMSYAEFIIACLDGRAGSFMWGDARVWKTIQPVWFRDPYGRVYFNPRVFDFTATFLEAVPGRTNFTMTLVLP